MAAVPEPFRLAVPPEALEGLRRHLSDAVLPDQDVPNEDWAYGAEKGYVESLAAYWRDGYDWRRWESVLNSIPQFTLRLPEEAGNPGAGLKMHFVHQRGSPGAVPLLLLHGWPGSFFEFHKLLPLLQRDFHVVAPSLPGYGFSGRPTRRGFDVAAMARTVDLLMRQLGYHAYVAQGGDWGGVICRQLGVLLPERCRAIHVNMLVAPRPQQAVPLSAADKVQLRAGAQWMKLETGYQQIQGTKPQTLGFALADSPIGLLAWIAEKFRGWSDCGGNPDGGAISRDELLTNVMIYWASGCITSSCRLYYETIGTGAAQGEAAGLRGRRCAVPTAHARFPKEPFCPPRPWAELAYDLRRWTEFDRGGHFAALEAPELLAGDVRAFFLDTVDARSLTAVPARL